MSAIRTVSKALNNSPLVKPDTKSKIIRAAREMGYEPNFAAQRLVKKESKVIGLAWPTIERITHSALASKINSEITKNAYSMILSIDPIQTSLEIFKRYQVDGVIVFDEESLESIASYSPSLPIVSYGVANSRNIPVIDVNYQKAMYTAVHYLYEYGHENIAFIGDFSHADDRQKEKYIGFQKALHHFGLTSNSQNLINTSGLSWYDGYVATKYLMNSSCIPSAIIGSSYDISAGIVRAVREANYDIPKDISIISYDNIPQMDNIEIPLTSVGVPIDVLAKQIVQTLFKYIQDKNAVPFVQTLTPILTERSSCGVLVDKSHR